MQPHTLSEYPNQHEEMIKEARERYADDNLEIDDKAQMIITPDGTWVEAWVWIPAEEPEI